MKNHFKVKSKTDIRFALAIERFISHNQYRPVHLSSVYPQCGCEHLKLRWKKEISFKWNQFTCGYNSYK